VNSDLLDMDCSLTFELWHDRAVFHFLTQEEEIAKFVDLANSMIMKGGIQNIATFSTEGPDRCSGLGVRQYDRKSL
jgi:hypothetical protein